jgi:hypothetical protein
MSTESGGVEETAMSLVEESFKETGGAKQDLDVQL